jgi:hypothetical protein
MGLRALVSNKNKRHERHTKDESYTPQSESKIISIRKQRLRESQAAFVQRQPRENGLL